MGDKQRVCGFANFCPQTPRRSFASVPPWEPRPSVWQPGSKPAGILLGVREHLSSLVRAKLGHGCLKIGEPEEWLLSSWRPPIIIPKERQNLSGKSHNQRSVIAEHGSSREVPATARARDRPAFSEQFANVISDPCCQRGQNPPSMHQIELVFFLFWARKWFLAAQIHGHRGKAPRGFGPHSVLAESKRNRDPLAWLAHMAHQLLGFAWRISCSLPNIETGECKWY